MTGSSWLWRSGSEAWPIISSDRTSRPMPTRMRPNWRQSRRSVAMNMTVPATRQIGTSSAEIEGQQLDHQRRADLGAAHRELAGHAADDAGAGEGADQQGDGGGALEGDRQAAPASTASSGLRMVARSLCRSTSP